MAPKFIYLFRAGDSGPVKIGVATTPASRLAAANTYTPQRITLAIVFQTDAARKLERAVHDDLSQHRMNGEWFDVRLGEAGRAVVEAANRLGCTLVRVPTDEVLRLKTNIRLSRGGTVVNRQISQDVLAGLQRYCETSGRHVDDVMDEVLTWALNDDQFIASISVGV